jgi:lysophospholipase L1-like esterase
MFRRIALVGCAVATLAAAGCGGSGDGGERAAGHRPIRVAALGDSITAGNPNYDPDPRQRRALGFGDDRRSQYEYWASRADPRLRWRNCGVFGETTAQIATRLRDCARGADALIVQGGINDIAQSLRAPAPVRRQAVNAAAANLAQMVEEGKRLRLRVAIAEVLPWNRGYPVAAPLIDRLNKLIELNAKLEQVPVLRFGSAIADPANPRLMQPRLTVDGDHPSVAGYRRIGELVAGQLRAPTGASGH